MMLVGMVMDLPYSQVTYVPASITAEQAKLALQAVKDAIQNPYEITYPEE